MVLVCLVKCHFLRGGMQLDLLLFAGHRTGRRRESDLRPLRLHLPPRERPCAHDPSHTNLQHIQTQNKRHSTDRTHDLAHPLCCQGTASLNVCVAASIVFHHFALWAGYPEHPRVGEKFVVQPRVFDPQSPMAAFTRARRAEQRAAIAAESSV